VEKQKSRKGVIHGKVIELGDEAGLPDGTPCGFLAHTVWTFLLVRKQHIIRK
jgi:hypothetical protein